MPDGSAQRVSTDPETGDVILHPAAPAVQRSSSEGVTPETNLATRIPKAALDELSVTITEQITYDDAGRDGWQKLTERNLKLLGTGPESDPDDPDDEASDTSDHPLLLTAFSRFQSKALSALLPGASQVCRYEPATDLDQIEDDDEREKLRTEIDKAGNRVVKYYSDYLLNQHSSYVEDTDLILADCGLHGVGLRKVYNDPSYPVMSTRVDRARVQDVIVSYDTSTWRCGRITHRLDMATPDLVRGLRSGFFRPVAHLQDGDLPPVDPITAVQDTIAGIRQASPQGGGAHRLYETRLDLFLNEDEHPQGLARPYIVTIHERTQEILSIRRNWSPLDEEERRIEQFVAYLFHPGMNAIHGIGLGGLLGNITRALRKAQREALNSAYLANHPSGFKAAGFSIRDDATKLRHGEFVDVDMGGSDDIRKALMTHPFNGAHPTLIALMEKMETNGRELGGIASIDFTQLMKAGIAAGPAMAAYEESTEFQTAIHRRLYDAQATEFRLIHARRREIIGNQPVEFGTNGILLPGDLTKVNIVPFMKPGQTSRQKQILEAQALKETAQQHPKIVNERRAVEEFLRALGRPDIDDFILPDPDDNPPQPMDPASEYVAILAGRPVRAAPHQNHQAHIDAHGAQMRGLQSSQLPIAQGEAAMAAFAAHIAEHMGLDMLVQTAARSGISLDQFGENMPPEIEAKLAPAVSSAIVQIEQARSASSQAPDPNAGKIEIERVKAAAKQAEQAARLQHERALDELKRAHEIELQRIKDEAAKEREDADNETALEIAELKLGSTPSGDARARAGAGAGAVATAKVAP